MKSEYCSMLIQQTTEFTIIRMEISPCRTVTTSLELEMSLVVVLNHPEGDDNDIQSSAHSLNTLDLITNDLELGFNKSSLGKE